MYPKLAHVNAVGAETQSTKTDASHIRRPCIPITRKVSSTTAPLLLCVFIMAHVPIQWKYGPIKPLANARISFCNMARLLPLLFQRDRRDWTLYKWPGRISQQLCRYISFNRVLSFHAWTRFSPSVEFVKYAGSMLIWLDDVSVTEPHDFGLSIVMSIVTVWYVIRFASGLM